MAEINESLLEMHYHYPLKKLFEKVFGAKCLNIFKPSTQKEVWLGFDQAWCRTKINQDQLFERLENGIKNQAQNNNSFYFGLFLQFKIVEKVTKRSKYFPPGYYTPYFRSELSLSPNKVTGISQHETLIRLNKIESANVAYACPMLFDRDDLHDETLDNLYVVDISTAPEGWLTNESHFITFQDKNASNTKWCSTPKEGKSMPFREWIRTKPKTINGTDAICLIKNTEYEFLPTELDIKKFDTPEVLYLPEEDEKKPTSVLPNCFSIFEFSKEESVKKNSSTIFDKIDLE